MSGTISYYYTGKRLNLCNSIIYTFLSYLHLIFLQHGDIESNAGPDENNLGKFSCCDLNFNSLVAYNFSTKLTPSTKSI